MSHSGSEPSTPATPGGGRPTMNGTYETVSVLDGRKRPPPGPSLHQAVLNTKTIKRRVKDNAQPLRAKPEDPEARKQRLAEAEESSSSETEGPMQKRRTSHRPPSNAVARPPNAAPVSMQAELIPIVPSAHVPSDPVPPATITVPIVQTAPSHHIPLHLVHPKLLPRPLVEFLRTLYLQEQKQEITEEDAMNLWTTLDESRRIQVVELYGRAAAQAQRQATDAQFAAKVPHKTSKKGGGVTKANMPPEPQQAVVHGTPLRPAAQFVMRNASATSPSLASQGSLSGYQAFDSSPTASFVSAASSESLGLQAMEDVVQHCAQFSSNITASNSPTPNVARTKLKGKGKAVESIQYDDDADDEDDLMEDEESGVEATPTLWPREFDSGPSTAMEPDIAPMDLGEPLAPPPNVAEADTVPAASAQSGHATIDPEIMLMFIRKVDGLGKAMHEQASYLRDLQEGNRAFQEEMLAELRALRAGSEKEATPKRAQPRAAAAILKVQTRSAKARGKEIELTPEQLEAEHRNRQINRMHAHMLSLLKVSDTTEIAISHPTLTDEQVADYKAGRLACTPQNYVVDFVRKWKSFSLNKYARIVAIRSFQNKAAGGAFAMFQPPDKMLTDEFLGCLIDQYMKTLRRAYNEGMNPKTEEEKEEFRRRCARNARMNTLYQGRLFVIVHMGYGRHSLLFSRMAPGNMSGDETDGPTVKHPPTYRVIIADWQSLILRMFLWSLDAKYIGYWEKPPKNRRSSGNPVRTRDVHIREGVTRTISGVAPVGLWRNCYNQQWLNTLADWEVEILEIIDEDYDFTLDGPTAGSSSTGRSRG